MQLCKWCIYRDNSDSTTMFVRQCTIFVLKQFKLWQIRNERFAILQQVLKKREVQRNFYGFATENQI